MKKHMGQTTQASRRVAKVNNCLEIKVLLFEISVNWPLTVYPTMQMAHRVTAAGFPNKQS